MMRLSHILYKVDDLDQAVRKFSEMGFTVVYGSNPKKAKNAFIWFEEGPFLELFTMNVNPVVYGAVTVILKILGKRSLLNRVKLFKTSSTGFCDVSIETDQRDLGKYIKLLTDKGYDCDRAKGRRTNIKGEKLNWQLAIPSRIDIPFLMSAYNIEQRPETIKHSNGAVRISEVVFATNRNNFPLFSKLIEDDGFKLVEGHGFIDMKVEGWDHPILHPNASENE